MKPVTDPKLLELLESAPSATSPSIPQMKPVTDPQLLGILNQSAVDSTTAFARGAGQGVTFGLADEGQGAVGALLELAAPTSPERKQMSLLERAGKFGEDYTTFRDAARQEYKQAQQDSPVATTLGNIVGSVPTVVATSGAGGVPRLAAQGGVAGFGSGEGGAISQGLSTLTGAGIGAVAGKAGDVVQAGVGKVANATEAALEKLRWLEPINKEYRRIASANPEGKVFADALEQSSKKVWGPEHGDQYAMQGLRYMVEDVPLATRVAKSVSGLAANPKDTALGALSGYVMGGAPGAVIGAGVTKLDAARAAAPYAIEAASNTVAKFTPIIERAVRTGTPFAAITFMLKQQSPEFRDAAQKVEDAGETLPGQTITPEEGMVR